MILAWLSLLIFSAAPASAADTRCDRAYGLMRPADAKVIAQLQAVDLDLALAFENSHQLKPELISGADTPKWADIELLDSILQSIKRGKAQVTKKKKWDQVNALIPLLAKYAKKNETLRRIAAAGNPEGAIIDGYQPTEYELKRLYQHKLWEINRELPPDLKIRGTRIPFDQRRNTLVKEARALIKAQERKYRSLYPSTGLPNREALVKAIKKDSPEARATLEMVEKEEVDFVMRRPEKGRWWIPKVGFQNQRISGSSKGTLSTQYRDTAEAFLTFGKKFEYEKLDNDLKPKYGYLRPKPGQVLVEERSSTSQYGEDFYILKKSNLRDRTTWTAGDSLGRGMSREPYQVPEAWFNAFTPWSDRALMVPVVLPEGKKREPFSIYSPEYSKRSPLRRFSERLPENSYLEMQYWGPVTLDDVEAFEFSGNPPSGEFLEELLKRKIKIRDATSGKPKTWKPPGKAR